MASLAPHIAVLRLPKPASSRTLASLASPRRVHQALSKRPETGSGTRPHVHTNHATWRCVHTTKPVRTPSPPTNKDRGPTSKEDTQTDFNAMNVLGNMPPPTTAVDMCMINGFALNSGLKVTGAGVLLVGGEVFKWRPWISQGKRDGSMRDDATSRDRKGAASSGGNLQNRKGQWEVDKEAWGILDLVWPKPDLLIIGTGPSILPLSPETRKHINDLGIRIELQDTRNAAAQFNLLATERGLQQVAAALIPIGWRDTR